MKLYAWLLLPFFFFISSSFFRTGEFSTNLDSTDDSLCFSKLPGSEWVQIESSFWTKDKQDTIHLIIGTDSITTKGKNWSYTCALVFHPGEAGYFLADCGIEAIKYEIVSCDGTTMELRHYCNVGPDPENKKFVKCGRSVMKRISP
jgi:hypothetical protein